MKHLIALAALLLSSLAQACAPSPFDPNGTKPVVGMNSVGAWAAWYCDDGYIVDRMLYAVRWDAVTPQMRTDFQGLTDAPNVALALQTFHGKHSTTSINDDRLKAVWEPDILRIKAAKPNIPPWRVAANGTSPDRPAYLFANGTRGAQFGRARVGAECDCLTRSVEGLVTYCRVLPTAQVAVCRRERP